MISKPVFHAHYELTAVGELLLAWVLAANMAININKLAFGRKISGITTTDTDRLLLGTMMKLGMTYPSYTVQRMAQTTQFTVGRELDSRTVLKCSILSVFYIKKNVIKAANW
jgi:hypothetical protein